MFLTALFLAACLFALFSGGGGARLQAPLLTLSGLLGSIPALAALMRGVTPHVAWPWPLPNAHLVLHLDALGALFLLAVCLVAPLLAWYGTAYWDDAHHPSARRLRVFFGLAVGAMQCLCGAHNIVAFLMAWEILALAGYFMITAEDREEPVRQAGWIYLVAAHAGALCLFGGFAILAASWGTCDFSTLPRGFATSASGTLAFFLLLAGFGLKAGLAPLHIWLPAAHAAAPSHVSALLSGLVIKMGILGMGRMILWVDDPPLWWGGTLTALGALSAILGLAFALGQRDLKRVLAYSSIENIGIITTGLGMALVGKSLARPELIVLGAGGACFHALNHAIFKPLLFLGAGSVLHATGTRDLERMGGLMKVMPWTGALFLLGATALSGLPPFNGFASEWLLYVGGFTALATRTWVWGAALVLALALAGGLAVATFTRAFGIAFLGEPRSEAAAKTHEAPRAMRIPMAILGGCCGLLGLAPILVSPALTRIAKSLVPGLDLPNLSATAHLGKLSLVAVLGLGFAWLAWTQLRHMRVRRAVTWDCGYGEPTARMQYTASSFGQMLVDALGWLLWPVRRLPRVLGLFPKRTHYESHLPDPVLDRTLIPALSMIARTAARMRTLQSGHLSLYLLYVVLTLVVLFAWTLA